MRLSRFFRRLRLRRRRPELESNLREEMQQHIDLLTRELMARGTPAEEARLIALRRFGNPVLLREQSRDWWGIPSLDHLAQDLRFGVRLLVRSPAVSLLATLTLALGIGANTAVFSLVDAVLLRPLPFPQPDRLMSARLTDAKLSDDFGSFGDADFLAWRDQQRTFSAVSAYAQGQSEFSFRDTGEPRRVRGVAVTAGFFDTLGVQPELGRNFQPDDDRADAPFVAMVSHQFWQTQLGGDPAVVGHTISVNGRPRTVVGVVRPGIRFPSNEAMDVWLLMHISQPQGRPPYYLAALGRLKPGATARAATEELSIIAKRLDQTYPTSTSWIGQVLPLKQGMTARVRTVLWVLLAAVLFVLLIAIANVANLLLARATARQQEIAVRLALGATRARILSQLVMESLLLSAIGAVFGVLLTFWAQRAFTSINSVVRIPMAYQVEIDGRVLLFTLVVSVLCAIVFGLAPALQGGGSLAGVLKDAARSSSGGARQTLRRVLVAAEFAIALVLLVGATLLIRSFVHLEEVSPGFNPDHILTAQISLPYALYPDEKAAVQFWDEYLRRAAQVPGVESVSLTLSAPPNMLALTNPFTAEGQPYDKSRPIQLAEEMSVSPGYFSTLGVPLLAGRDFNDGDRNNKQSPIIINRTLAERYFPGKDPIGRHLQTGDPHPDPPNETIIGVVGDMKYSGLDSAPIPQAYKVYSDPGWASFSYSLFVVLRTKTDDAGVIAGLRRQLASMDPNVALAKPASMREMMGESVGEQRFRTLVLGSFAGFALLLACFGIYAVMSYSVGQRTRELGIRVALGATRGELLGLVLRQALTLCCAGLAVGVVAAIALTRALRSLLFGVTPSDPISFVATIGILLAVALLASYIPARRATRVDPIVALRYE
jgi:putative ABC transport system permease protein